MGNIIKERFKEFLKHLKIGQGKFEANCGIGNGTINNIKDGISSPNLEKISNRYPQISLDWLITGKGEMLKNETPVIGSVLYESENARLHRENESLSKKVITLLEELRELERKPTAVGALDAPAGKAI